MPRPVFDKRNIWLNPGVNWIIRILVDGVVHLLYPRQRPDGSEIVVRGGILIFKTADQGEIKNNGGEIRRWVSHKLRELETAAKKILHLRIRGESYGATPRLSSS